MRISEIYASVQGEGPRVGIPTIFVRTGGCNLRCPGWPCDTPHAIDPAKYRHEWEKVGPPQLLSRVTTLAAQHGISNVCLTGGEPFLQPSREVMSFAHDLQECGYLVECFSNGTLKYPNMAPHRIHFIMDWKLPGSGEDPHDKVRYRNLEMLVEGSLDQAVKFVIKDWADFVCAKMIWEDTLRNFPEIEVFYGVAWGHLENSELVKWVMEHALPWRLNVQVHNYIWNREDRGI